MHHRMLTLLQEWEDHCHLPTLKLLRYREYLSCISVSFLSPYSINLLFPCGERIGGPNQSY
jgi:hypothetical protein